MEPAPSSAAPWGCAQVKAAPCHLQLVVHRCRGSKEHEGCCLHLVSEEVSFLLKSFGNSFSCLFIHPCASPHPSPARLSVRDADLRLPLRPR